MQGFIPIDPSLIIEASANYTKKDVGRLGRALAANVFFGDDVLVQSTPRGDKNRGLARLDPVKLSQIMTLIHHHSSFANLSKTEFNTLVQHNIIPSIRDYCKELRRNRKN